jgi:quinoprotein glucose dehydrogenase
MNRSILILLFLGAYYLSACNSTSPNPSEWPVYGGSKSSTHYSSLDQINLNNIKELGPAWIYHTHDSDTSAHSQIQCNPIMVHNTLYVTSPRLRLLALNPETGQPKWIFNPMAGENHSAKDFNMNNNRGVTYWEEGSDKRIFYCAGSFLYSVNAETGALIREFGLGGKVDLHENLGVDAHNLYVTATSPGIIYKDLYILGSRVNETADAAPGHIRAFDVRTGKLRWIFHTIPQPGETGYETWPDKEAWKHIGSANSWAGFSLDESRGILYAPTGSAAFDFYGGKRLGKDLYANCILALDAEKGQLIWYYQVVHHDLWDKDLPLAPVLISLKIHGKAVDALAQPTKHGFVFVLDRVTGKPLFPVNETPVDTLSELMGEHPFPTQPIPQSPVPFVRQTLSIKDINPYLSKESRDEIGSRMKNYRFGNMFIPPGHQSSIIFPGFDGGAEWGGEAFDSETGILYVNANEMAWILTMIDAEKNNKVSENYLEAGKRLYAKNCLTCHGSDRKGAGNYPSLLGISRKYPDQELSNLISSGRRMMPSFHQLKEEEKKAIISYLTVNLDQGKKSFKRENTVSDPYLNLPYQMDGYHKFLSREGQPAIGPPWGTLNAIDLNSGKIVWKVPLGEDSLLTQKGIPKTGTENYGGPILTAGGLIFIAATRDSKIRAFDKNTGKEVWEAKLPACGFATPSTYKIGNKQYLVIACGGGKLNTPSGDAFLAFSLASLKP